MKNPFMKVNKTKDFVKLLENDGYVESSGKGSHRVFRKNGGPTLSIPNERELAPGTKRNLLKLYLGDDYYNK
jgi:predicted RNA binding protein YcfA (HicA-like mRNA interferase family)